MARRVVPLRPGVVSGRDDEPGAPPVSAEPTSIDAVVATETATDTAGGTAAAAVGAPAAEAKPRRRRARRAARAATGDVFSERLRELEREIDEALAGAAKFEEHGVVTGARDAVEELLALYVDLARAFREG